MADFLVKLHSLSNRYKGLKRKFLLQNTTKVCFHLNTQLGKIQAVGRQTDAENKGKYQYLSQGDDGFVLRYIPELPDEDAHVLKIFKSPPINELDFTPTQEELLVIPLDQAKREFSGLSLLMGHPNVPLLLSHEIDICDLVMDGIEYCQAYALKLSYISNLKPCGSQVFSDVFGVVETDEGLQIDYEHRNKLIKYLWGQAALLTTALKEAGIYHRDVDSVNLKIQTPDLRLCLMDFARASIPLKTNLPFTDDPDMLCDETLFLDRAKASLKSNSTNQSKIQEKLQLFKLQKNRLININQELLCDDPTLKIDDSTHMLQDMELLFYFITRAIKNHNENSIYKHEQKFTLNVMIPHVKELFLNDIQSVVQWASCPENDLIKFKRVFTILNQKSTQKDIQLFVKSLNTISYVHSEEYLSYNTSKK